MVLTAADTVVPVDADSIPDVLKAADRWCVWRPEPGQDGKLTKKPMQASWPSRGLSKTTPSQWRPFATALKTYESTKGIEGVGFVCGGGFVALDFDECCDEVTREVRPDVAEALARLNTYSEFSPSGRGVRAFLLGELPGPNVTSKDAGVELYAEGAYVTVTGFQVPGTPATVAEGGAALVELYQKAKAAQAAAKERREAEKRAAKRQTAKRVATICATTGEQGSGRPVTPSVQAALSDEELREVALRSAAGADIQRLLNGQWQGAYPTQSEAELALANHLAFYAGSGGDAQVARLMQASGLNRDKFNEPRGEGTTYLSITVAKAFSGRTDFYAPRSKARASKTAATAVELPNGMASTGPADLNDSSTLTDVGLARRLVLQAGRKLRYVREWRSWLSWDGRRWLHDDGLAAAHAAKQVSDVLWRELAELPPERRGQVLAFVKAASSARGIEAAVKLARSEPEVVASAAELNAHPYLLNVANGTLNLLTAELRPHAPADLLTHIADVAFDHRASCPTFRGFLRQVTNEDAELEAFLRRSFGLAMSGDVSEQVLWLHHGEGRNGKSTLLNVLVEILGTYAGPAPMDMLLVRGRHAKEAETQFAALSGKRLVTTVEADSGVRFSEATVKLLTGGDVVLARRLYEDAWPVKPSWKLHVAANHKPTVQGTDEGIWRRLMLTPWLRRFEGAAEDKQLKEKLLAERAGILNWALAGFVEWREQGGLRPPACVLAATKEYRGENDVLGIWLDECCVKKPGAVAEAAALYRSYKSFCEDRGERVLTATAFGTQLERLGFQGRRHTSGQWRNKTVREGLGLLDAGKSE